MRIPIRTKRWLLAAGVLGCLAAPMAAQSPKFSAQYAKLEAKALAQSGPQQAETLARLAEMDFALAHDAFVANQTAAAEQHLDRAVQRADQACRQLQSEAALGKTDGMKNVEVSMQKIGYGLRDLALRVNYLQRPAVQAAANHFADLRDQLLQTMFAPKKKG